jgi:hypothetical protein
MRTQKMQKFDSKHVSAGIFGGGEAVMNKGAREEVVQEASEVRIKVEKGDRIVTIGNMVVGKPLDNGDQKSEMAEEAFDVRVEDEKSGSKAAESGAEHGNHVDDGSQKLQKFDSKHVFAGNFEGEHIKQYPSSAEDIATADLEAIHFCQRVKNTGGIEIKAIQAAGVVLNMNKGAREEVVQEASKVRIKVEKDESKPAERAEHGNNVDDGIQYLGHRFAKENSDDVPTVFALERVKVNREEEKRRSNALLMGKLAYETSRQAKIGYSDLFDNMKPEEAKIWVEEWDDDVVLLKTPSKVKASFSTNLSPVKRTSLQFDRKQIDNPNNLLQNRKQDTPLQEKALTPLKRKQLEAKAAWAAGYAERMRVKSSRLNSE